MDRYLDELSALDDIVMKQLFESNLPDPSLYAKLEKMDRIIIAMYDSNSGGYLCDEREVISAVNVWRNKMKRLWKQYSDLVANYRDARFSSSSIQSNAAIIGDSSNILVNAAANIAKSVEKQSPATESPPVMNAMSSTNGQPQTLMNFADDDGNDGTNDDDDHASSMRRKLRQIFEPLPTQAKAGDFEAQQHLLTAVLDAIRLLAVCWQTTTGTTLQAYAYELAIARLSADDRCCFTLQYDPPYRLLDLFTFLRLEVEAQIENAYYYLNTMQ